LLQGIEHVEELVSRESERDGQAFTVLSTLGWYWAGRQRSASRCKFELPWHTSSGQCGYSLRRAMFLSNLFFSSKLRCSPRAFEPTKPTSSATFIFEGSCKILEYPNILSGAVTSENVNNSTTCPLLINAAVGTPATFLEGGLENPNVFYIALPGCWRNWLSMFCQLPWVTWIHAYMSMYAHGFLLLYQRNWSWVVNQRSLRRRARAP